MSGAVVSSVVEDSPAHRAGILTHDEILSINGRAPTDIIEYQQLIDGDDLDIIVQRPGESLQRRLRVDKGVGERLGLTIESAVFDRIRTCDNHCSFCFIYQLPKGMRRSLYVKDDDFRLSFLYGNYTTLTRFTEFDLERVIDENLSPLYVSIHTTDPVLRADMLRNPRGASSLRWLRALLDAGVEVHGQVVVCPGVNDGDVLVRTLDDVVTTYPELATVSVVPLGLSDFSQEPTMRAHLPEEAAATVDLVGRYAQLCVDLFGRRLIHASDEFYLLAGQSPPSAQELESLDQAENGVGLVAAFEESFATTHDMETLGSGSFQSVDGAPAWGYRAERYRLDHAVTFRGRPTILTGEYAAPLLERLLREHGYTDVDVMPVVNRYFGGNIKVAGLLTGSDIQRATAEGGPDRLYLLPDLCLSEDLFLDGLRFEDVDAHIAVVPTSGVALRRALDEIMQNVTGAS